MGIAGSPIVPRSYDDLQQSCESPSDVTEAITSSLQQTHLDDTDSNVPPTTPDAPMSSGGSVSSTETHDLLAPLPTMMTNQDRPSLRRRSSLSPRLSAQPSFSSPTLPSLSELLVSPPLPDEYDQSQSYFPPFNQRSSHSKSSSTSNDHLDQSPLSSRVPDAGLPTKAASDSGTFTRRANKTHSPRIKNTGGILAPHGSFTSSSRSRSSTFTSNSSRSPQPDSYDAQEMDQKEREKLLKAASKGDQLAMHRLGWRPPPLNKRHTLGSADDIWGGTDYIPSNITRRSSGSSRASSPAGSKSNGTPTSTLDSPTPPATTTPTYTQSDLFFDAVTLTLRSNAFTKNRNPNAHENNTGPPPRRPSTRKKPA